MPPSQNAVEQPASSDFDAYHIKHDSTKAPSVDRKRPFQASGKDSATTEECSHGRKKLCKAAQEFAGNLLGRPATTSSPLKLASLFTKIITQYAVLERLAANLIAKDLLSLALTSRLAYESILPNKESRCNFTNLSLCDGSGVRIRERIHRKPRFPAMLEYVLCGSEDKDKSVETKPCHSCGVNTCEECRIHCTYQSHYLPPDEEDELPYYYGYSLLDPNLMGILSPQHMNEPGTWSPPVPDHMKPYHDQGFLDIPLDSDTYESPVLIDSLTTLDLGHSHVNSYGRVFLSARVKNRITQPFSIVSEERKRLMCSECFESQCVSPITELNDKLCHCSLKSRFLDRWLCLKCYLKERSFCNTFKIGVKKDEQDTQATQWRCTCGKILSGSEDSGDTVLCLWCRKQVLDKSFKSFQYPGYLRLLSSLGSNGKAPEGLTFQEYRMSFPHT